MTARRPSGGQALAAQSDQWCAAEGARCAPRAAEAPGAPTETVRKGGWCKGGWCKGGGEHEAPCARDKVEKTITINP